MATRKQTSSTMRDQLEQAFQPKTPEPEQPPSAPADVEDVQFRETPRAPLPDTEPTETDDQALMRVLGSLGNDDEAMVLIYRQGPKYEDQTYIDECPPSEFRLSMLQEEPYNGGTFRIHVRGAGKTGFLANRKIKVQPKAKKPDAVPAADVVTSALAQMQQQNAAMMKELMTTMQAMRQPAPQQSPMDLIAMIKLVKELTVPAPAAPAAAAEQIGLFKEVVAMAKTMSEMTGGAPEDPLLRGLERLAAPMLTYMAAQKQNQAVPQPTTMPTVEEQPAVQPEPEQDPMMMIRTYFAMLIAKAEAQVDPTPYAYLILEHVPQEMIDDRLRPDNWLDRLAEIDPRVKNHQEWFADLRNLIFELLTPESDADTTEPDNGSGVSYADKSSAHPTTTATNTNPPGNS